MVIKRQFSKSTTKYRNKKNEKKKQNSELKKKTIRVIRYYFLVTLKL
jgi:hypothetical protein